MTLNEASQIVMDLASQGALDENHVDDEQQEELARQNEAIGMVAEFLDRAKEAWPDAFDAE